jgi:membrane-bound ClpP family serine protease
MALSDTQVNQLILDVGFWILGFGFYYPGNI